MPSAREAHLNGTASTRVLTTMLETVVELASTTPSPFHITKNESSVANKTTSAPNELMTRRGFFMHMIGGWVLTAIFIFGILFMVVTHFLGRREWRKYQERLEEERAAVNHVIVDSKYMKYTKKGWREIALSL